MYLNKALVLGRLTRDPDLKSLPSGANVGSFSVATNRTWTDKDGMKKENVDFHNIVVFGRQAESCAQFLKKGQLVLIEGRLQTRSWDNKAGGKMHRTEIVADRVQFGPKASQNAHSAAEGGPVEESVDYEEKTPQASKTAATGQSKPKVGSTDIDYPEEQINPDDIPF